MSSLRTGADIAQVFCSKGAAIPIKSYGPEVITMPMLYTEIEVKDAAQKGVTAQSIVEEMSGWLSRLHVLVIGPGLGRDVLVQQTACAVIKEARNRKLPLVIDADGLWTIENDYSVISGYTNAVLTPNVNEFQRLCSKILQKDVRNETNPQDSLMELAKKLGHLTIVRKGATDLISDGRTVIECDYEGSPRRCGGQGDVLSGIMATFVNWALIKDSQVKSANEEPVIPPLMLAAYGACALVRECARTCFDSKKRSMVGFDLVEFIGPNFNRMYENKSAL